MSPADQPRVQSLGEMVAAQAIRHGERPAITLADGTLSYRALDELANQTANALLARGIGVGHIVAALCGNRQSIVATWLGCAKAGAVFMPVNPLLTNEPLRAVLDHAQASTVVVDADLVEAFRSLDGPLDAIRHVFVAGDDLAATTEGTTGWESFETMLAEAPPTPPPRLGGGPSTPTKLMYTSGTTGVPKGVVWSRACEATWGMAYGEEMVPIAVGESVYCCLPLSHVTCQGTTLATWWNGGHITIDPTFDAFAFWRRVRETDAVMFTFVGTILSVLGRRRPRPDDRNNPVRRILGAAAPADLWRDIEERFDLEVVDVWGQTETASCWTVPTRFPQVPGTVGRVVDRFEARLIDPAETEAEADCRVEVATGAVGELWIRPTRPDVMFAGYLAPGGLRSDGSAALDRTPWTDDGWYRSGDLMSRDDTGDYRFAGRIREAIRRRGEMISAGPIEEAARAHHGVAEAAAVGVPADDGVEEEIKLAVIAQDDSILDPADLHAHLCERLPRFMVPRYIDVRDDLPKTPTTRVRKFALVADGVAGTWDSRRRNIVAPAPDPSTPPNNGALS